MASVGVVIPARNAEQNIRACVASCRDQSVPPLDVVVVDNASRDRTSSEAAEGGARVLLEPQIGSYRARNRGWLSVDADIIAFTDADCQPEGNWLEEILKPFSDPTVVVVGGDIRQADTFSATQQWLVNGPLISQSRNAGHPFLPFLATANVAIRRTALEQIHGFDDAFISGGDVDICWRIQAFLHGKVEYRPSAVVNHHVGPRLREITERGRRYGAGRALIDLKWSAWPDYPKEGLRTRMRPAWLLPARLAHRILKRHPLAPPLIEAALVVNLEVGYVVGKWGRTRGGLTLTPLSGASG